MIRPQGLRGYGRLTWWLLSHEWRGLLIATLLCGISLPANATIAGVLLPDDLLQVLGILLAFFLGFRYSQAYNRWWEARVLWGALVNESRNWRDVLTAALPRTTPLELRLPLLQLNVLLVWLVNGSLRAADGAPVSHPPAVMQLASSLRIRPPTVQAVLQVMAARQRDLLDQQVFTRIERLDLGRVQQALTRAIGGLERIRRQPLPVSSTFCIQALTWVYGYLVFLKLDARGDFSSALVGWLAFLTLLMAERIGTFLENPFVDARFALPLDRICRVITADLLGRDHPLADPSADQHDLHAGPVIT